MPRENPPPLKMFYRSGGRVRLVGVHPRWPEPDRGAAAPKKKKPKDYLAFEEEKEWRL